MAAPLTPERMLKALRAEGVNVREYRGWTSHNRNSKGPFADINGIMLHHTAGRDSLTMIWSGTVGLPGPLAHAHLSKVGVLTLTSSGRANHAGEGSRDAFDAVLRERSHHPVPGPDEVDGNAHFYGLEIENLGNGRDPYPAVQYEAAVRYAAALCRAYGWSADSVIGHKEWTSRKIDPSFGMGVFRKDVAARLAHPASWDGKETTVTGTPVPGRDTEAPRPQAYRDVMETDAIPVPSNLPGAAAQGFWTTESYLRFIAEKLITIERKLDS